MKVSRRGVVAALVSGAALGAGRSASAQTPGASAPAGGLAFGPPRPFSWAALQAQAKALARQPFQPRADAWADRLGELDFDAIGQIRYRPEAALWLGDDRIGAVEFFHLGRYARTPVTLHVVEGGVSREVRYATSLFDIPADSPAGAAARRSGLRRLPGHESAARRTDWIAYAGRLLFPSRRSRSTSTACRPAAWRSTPPAPSPRSSRPSPPSGSSTRRRGPGRPRPAGRAERRRRLPPRSTVRAPRAWSRRSRRHSLSGAAVKRLGIAPLTSMYWYGAVGSPGRAPTGARRSTTPTAFAIWTGAGERIWRPLTIRPGVDQRLPRQRTRAASA